MLAAKGVPVGSKDSSAGFFFWQTKNGFRFKSVDGLIKDALAAKSSAQRYISDRPWRIQIRILLELHTNLRFSGK